MFVQDKRGFLGFGAVPVRFEPQGCRGCSRLPKDTVSAVRCRVSKLRRAGWMERGNGLSFVRGCDFSLPRLARPLPCLESSIKGQSKGIERTITNAAAFNVSAASPSGTDKGSSKQRGEL